MSIEGMTTKRHPDGYLMVYIPVSERREGQPRWALAHRLVMELEIGRPLLPGEVVHHRNGDRTDNRIENLELHPSSASHNREHRSVDRGEILRLYESGLGTRTIAARLGCGVATAHAAVTEVGVGRSGSEAAALRERGPSGRFAETSGVGFPD